MQEMSREFYTVGELAALLHVKPVTIYRKARAGEIPHHTIGRAIRFRRQDVETFLANVRVPAGADS